MFHYAPLPAVNHGGFGWIAEIFTGIISLAGAALQMDTMRRQRKSARHQRERDQYAQQLADQNQQKLIESMTGGGVPLGPGGPAYGPGGGQQQQQKMPAWVLPAAVGGGGLLLLLVVLK
jgi:hypothetical protein